MERDEGISIVRIGIVSRFICVVWMIVGDRSIADHRASGVYLYETKNEWLRAFTRWDSAHFLRIAAHGYKNEKDAAFYPSYPWMVRLLGGNRRHFIISSLLISNSFFVLACFMHYKVSLRLLRSPRRARLSALLFCVHPASVFSSTAYAESLFAASAFSGIYALTREKYWLATLLFLSAGFTRSNGFLLGLFFLARLFSAQSHLFTDILRGAIVASPPLILDAASYVTRCQQSATRPIWCSHSFSLYATVQRRYWNVGFLRCWRLKQVPNFMLASPAIFLAFRALLLLRRKTRTQSRQHKYAHVYLGLWLHCAVSLLLLLLFAHIEISTRVLFHSTLLVSWTLADDIFDNYAAHCKSRRYYARALIVYIFLFSVLGTAAHANFYPWT